MLSGSPIIAFVSALDAAAARAFYADTLGLRLVCEDPFALVFDAAGTELRVTKVESLAPQPFTVLGWAVDDIAGAVAALAARGVAFKRFPSLQQDADGVWSTPGGAKVAWFCDPAGNLLSLTELLAP